MFGSNAQSCEWPQITTVKSKHETWWGIRVKSSVRGATAPTKILLHIESKLVNSRLLRKIIKKREDIAILTAQYDEQALAFIRREQPAYLVANLDDLGNNPNQVNQALETLNEIHTGKLIVCGYDTSPFRGLRDRMSNLVLVDFPLTIQILLALE